MLNTVRLSLVALRARACQKFTNKVFVTSANSRAISRASTSGYLIHTHTTHTYNTRTHTHTHTSTSGYLIKRKLSLVSLPHSRESSLSSPSLIQEKALPCLPLSRAHARCLDHGIQNSSYKSNEYSFGAHPHLSLLLPRSFSLSHK